MMNSHRFTSLGILYFLCLVLAGCSGSRDLGPTVNVNGKITLDGEPFTDAQIWFSSPKSGAGFETNLNPDGTYSIDIQDAQVGESYNVYFMGAAPEQATVDGAGAPGSPPPPPIPSKYWDGATSGLTAKLTDSGDQTFDFDLKSE